MVRAAAAAARPEDMTPRGRPIGVSSRRGRTPAAVNEWCAASAEDGDMPEVPILFRVVEPVADDELVLDVEPDVLDRHLDAAPRRLAQKARGAKRARTARLEDVLQIGERQPGVDDVFDDDDVAAV